MRIVGGSFKNRILIAPKSILVRPSAGALREAVFNICRHTINGATVLDLFAGSGAIGLEALSRGATHVTFVDNNRESIRCIHENIRALQLENCTTVLVGDVLRIMDKLIQQQKSYDFLFADPPYGKGPTKDTLYSQCVLDKVDTHALLKEEGELFIEEIKTHLLKEDHLQHLQLKSSRRLGTTSLYHYLKKGKTT
jgi:16S rRNA (guanine966-N2)-methyltransferase